MSIVDLDIYTIDAIMNLLDIQSLYNFSRTCQKFKDVCHEIKDKRAWQKQVYGVFAKTVFDSIDASNVRRTSGCNLFFIKACLNVIQCTYDIQENVTARFDDNTKHSNEVIELMLVLSEVLLNLNYDENCLLFVEGIVHQPDDDERCYGDEEECGFVSYTVDRLALHYFYGIKESEIKKKRIDSLYYKIFKEFDMKLFLKKKEFQDFCCKIRTMTKLDEVPDTIIAIALQTLFGPTIKKISYHKKESVRTITTKELRLLKNQVFTLRNDNLKHILARTDLSELIQYCTSLYYFVSKEKFKDFMYDLIAFVKTCKHIDIGNDNTFMENKEITTFLLQSSYNVGPKYRYNLAGIDTSLDMVYWRDEGGWMNCSVNDVALLELEWLCYKYHDEDFKQVLAFFNDFIDRNYDRKDGKTIISAQYFLSFLKFLFQVKEPVAYSYKQFYHMSLINIVQTKESIKRKRAENTLELQKQRRSSKAKK